MLKNTALAEIVELSMTLHLTSEWLMAAENVTTFIFFRDEESHGPWHCDPDRDDSISRENLPCYRMEAITESCSVFVGIYGALRF